MRRRNRINEDELDSEHPLVRPFSRMEDLVRRILVEGNEAFDNLESELNPSPTYTQPHPVDFEEDDHHLQEALRASMEDARREEEARRRREEEEIRRFQEQQQRLLSQFGEETEEDDHQLQEALRASMEESRRQEEARRKRAEEEKIKRLHEQQQRLLSQVAEEEESRQLQKALQASLELKTKEEENKRREEARKHMERQDSLAFEELMRAWHPTEAKEMDFISDYIPPVDIPTPSSNSISTTTAMEDEEEELERAIRESVMLHESSSEAQSVHPIFSVNDDDSRTYLGSFSSPNLQSSSSSSSIMISSSSSLPFTKEDLELHERRLLKAQQDREFREALERDVQKEREAERERQIAAEEAKRAAEEAQRQRQMAAEEAQRALEREQNWITLLDQMKAKGQSLPPEPLKTHKDAVDIAIRLPSGQRAIRRFPKTAFLRTVKDWVDSEIAKEEAAQAASKSQPQSQAQPTTETTTNEADVKDQNAKGTNSVGYSALVKGYDLVADFPRRKFEDLSVTVGEAGLGPRAMLAISLH